MTRLHRVAFDDDPMDTARHLVRWLGWRLVEEG
jgi:hypothetical protein